MGKKHVSLLVACLFAVGAMFSCPAEAALPPDAVKRTDPSVQLNRTREYMERMRVQEQIAEDEAARKAKIEDRSGKAGEEKKSEISFVLKEIRTDVSSVLLEEEIDELKGPYLNQDVTLKDLYALTEKINRKYEEKGYITCRAVLPPQTIHEGVVEIRLVEGKTGNIAVEGNRHTRDSYIKNRLPLKPGTISGTRELTKALQRFNGTNDTQLHIVLQAGKEPGTTDYVILVGEPERNQTVSLYMDNAGYKTTGELREGIFYNYRSLTGRRDNLGLSYLRSRGSDAFGASYSIPLGRKGTRLDLSYNSNSTEIVKGGLEDLNVKGHGYSAGATLRQPILIDENKRMEAGLQFLHSRSKTDSHTINYTWVDDHTNRYIPYFSLINYGKSTVLYQKHSIEKGSWSGPGTGIADDYVLYNFNGIYQKRFKHGQMFQSRIEAQLASRENIPSGERFYLGGIESVRGYEESYLSGDEGYRLSLQYQVPVSRDRKVQAFTFFDYGKVFGTGDNYEDSVLMSTGLGVTASYKDITASVTLGVPLKRELNGEEVNRAHVNFTVYGVF